MFKIGFIGMGNMGYAILKGIEKEFNRTDICFFEYLQSRREEIAEEEDIFAASSNTRVVSNSKYIILAVKPQVLPSVCSEIRDSITEENILISLAPGISVDDIAEMTGCDRIVRTMPNTPALVGEGMTGICYDEEDFTEDEVEDLDRIFSSFGKYRKVDEHLMNAVVCASGSSPAYVFMFIEALADSAVKCGMKRSDAYEFVAQTVLGSAKLMLESGKHPGELKDMVCSPGGTTIAAVEQLEKNGFRGALFEATKACFDKCNNID